MSGDPSNKYFSLRRFVALGSVFLFVLAWHGTSSNYFYWVLLNCLEICMEWFGAAVYKTAFYAKIQKFLGPRGERRLIAYLMVTTVVPGKIFNPCTMLTLYPIFTENRPNITNGFRNRLQFETNL